MSFSSLDLVILGPPGSGRSTQARRLAERYEIPRLAAGELVRAEAERTGDDELRRCLAEARLAPDAVVAGLILTHLDRPECSRGVVLDGFPRTLRQAELLDGMLAELGRSLERVVILELDEERALGRLLGDRPDGPDELQGRRRLADWRQHAAGLSALYERRGLLQRVDAGGSEASVAEMVSQVVATAVGT